MPSVAWFRRLTLALLLSSPVVGCGGPSTVTVSGQLFEFDAYLTQVIAGAGTRDAFAASTVAGATVTLSEDALVRSLSSDADGRYVLPGAPAKTELHPITRRFDDQHLVTEDGLGVQYPEQDVVDYALPIMANGVLLAAIADGFGVSADGLYQQGFQLYAFFDAPFPAGAPITILLRPSLNSGRWLAIGWNDADAHFVTQVQSVDFPAGARWLGLIAITDADEAAHLTLYDESGSSRPKVFVQHPMLIVPLRAQLFLLPPVN